MIRFWYINGIFFIWTRGEEKLKKFMDDFNVFNPNIQLTYESSKKSNVFVDLLTI